MDIFGETQQGEQNRKIDIDLSNKIMYVPCLVGGLVAINFIFPLILGC